MCCYNVGSWQFFNTPHRIIVHSSDTAHAMEQRQHSRIQIPLLVELQHPALGTVQSKARDISEGGIFVFLDNPPVKTGSKLKLRLLTVLPTDTQPTPTVEMEVKRVAENGLGLAFINRTAEHLWSTVEHLRSELQIGRDYFQIHQSLALTHAQKGVLLVQQNGKWLFPGYFLLVGNSAIQSATEFVRTELGLDITSSPIPTAVDSMTDTSVSEAAVYSVILTTSVTSHQVQFSEQSFYKDWRWLNKARDLSEITFALDLHRKQAQLLLEVMSTD